MTFADHSTIESSEALEDAFSDVDDDAYRRGGAATVEDVDRAVARYALDSAEAAELANRVVAAGLLAEEVVPAPGDSPALTTERVMAIRSAREVPEALELYLDRIG